MLLVRESAIVHRWSRLYVSVDVACNKVAQGKEHMFRAAPRIAAWAKRK